MLILYPPQIKHLDTIKASIFICLAVSEDNVVMPVSVSRGWQLSAQWRSWCEVIQTSGYEARVPSDQDQHLGSLYWKYCHKQALHICS